MITIDGSLTTERQDQRARAGAHAKGDKLLRGGMNGIRGSEPKQLGNGSRTLTLGQFKPNGGEPYFPPNQRPPAQRGKPEMDKKKALLLRGVEVAEALGISRALAYRWMQTGVLPVVRINRSVRVPVESLEEWVRTNTTHKVAGTA